ncbi:MAG: acyl-ACP--UDP-N-acetylglucosamine O-acyltransferase [Synergistes sp.]|nr:acyl-ACP--UDP-N-acetylglucosamine O-acyltransferase [Synergistes sp.]
MSIEIHPTAIVDKNAELGNDVKIGPFCVVDGKTTIGDGTILRPFSRVCEYTILGKECVIYEHAVIGGAPQDLSYKGEETWAVLDNKVVCREYVTINRATGEGQKTTVGEGTFIMENVHLAHNVQVGKYCTIANKSGISGHVHVGDYVVIGGMTGFHQFVHIGSYCMIGGLSRITQDVPPYALSAGIPLRVYDINRVGLRRRGFDTKRRQKIRGFYKLIYNSGLTVTNALKQLEADYGSDEDARLLLDFAAGCTRGLTPRITREEKRKEAEFN